jgi:hypothetical protein
MAWVDMVGTWGCAPTAAAPDIPGRDALDGDLRTALLSGFEGDFEVEFKVDFGDDFDEVRPNAFGEDFAEAVLATLRDLAGLRDGIGRLTAPRLREERGAVADSRRWVTPPSGKSCIDTRNRGDSARVQAPRHVTPQTPKTTAARGWRAAETLLFDRFSPRLRPA